ncbi:hypothetical protein NLK61_24470 [Pseudomonas fuscovaginae UPB0736]|uniref:hypothetical protein n=1 Tax=Pseudomonas asplenii TaxID=53407 RepID=UPI000288BBEB|nr:hypothetical protein [Pseudomonas fuscovaginae]UUQ64334.1 hypothetical protein NLK61_24470 [Pseudomonas fuscovaginae UPB0736]
MKASDILPDDMNSTHFAGLNVRKGTVAAFLHNAKTWSESTSDEERAKAQRDILESLPALRALGLFDVLAIRDARLCALVDAH